MKVIQETKDKEWVEIYDNFAKSINKINDHIKSMSPEYGSYLAETLIKARLRGFDEVEEYNNIINMVNDNDNPEGFDEEGKWIYALSTTQIKVDIAGFERNDV